MEFTFNRNEIFLPHPIIDYTIERIKPVIVAKPKTSVSDKVPSNNQNICEIITITLYG